MENCTENLSKDKDLFLLKLQKIYAEMQIEYIDRQWRLISQKRSRHKRKAHAKIFIAICVLTWLIFLLKIYQWQQYAILHAQ